MPKEEVTPPDVEIINDETSNDTTSQSQVTIDLDQKSGAVKTDEPKPTSNTSQDFSKLNNTMAYQTRKLEQAMRRMAELEQQIASRQTPQTNTVTTPTNDPADALAQVDWKGGVKMVVEPEIERKIAEAFTKKEQAAAEDARRQSNVQKLEASKQKVLSKYPSIEDESTEEAQIYREVINEDPSVLSVTYGPEIAMYRMEEKLRELGRTPAYIKPMVQKEVNRMTRAGASNTTGRQINQGNKITLTKDQKEFCDHNKLDYAQYAKHIKMQESQGGVEV